MDHSLQMAKWWRAVTEMTAYLFSWAGNNLIVLCLLKSLGIANSVEGLIPFTI